MSIEVTKGELQVIVGFLVFGSVMTTLKTEGCLVQGHPDFPSGIPGSIIVESLNGTNAIDLTLEEVQGMFTLLVANGIMPQTAKDKIDAYVVQKTAATNPPDPSDELVWSYRIPLSAKPAGLLVIEWAKEFCTAANNIWLDGEWVYIRTAGALNNAPEGTEVAQ